jgi:hypothetical protein
MEYIATFYTQSGAIKYQRYLRREGVDVELRPVPRELSSDCGIAACFSPPGDVRQYISEDMEKIFKICAGEYTLIYENECCN